MPTEVTFRIARENIWTQIDNFRFDKTEPIVRPAKTQVSQKWQQGDVAVFESLFKTHYRSLCAYALLLLRDKHEAEEVVQQVFYRMWEKRNQIKIETSEKAYLYRAVRNDCLNFLKREKLKAAYEQHAIQVMENRFESPRENRKELESQIHLAVNELPEQCQLIFKMSRFEEMKYREIASELNISVKTVENQMGKALKFLRDRLKEYLPLVVLFVIANLLKHIL